MASSIFSTYSTAENRVTSTILSVFEKLNSNTVTQILQVLMDDSTVELIKYENQVWSEKSVPDGRIKGLFDYVIETKVVPDSIDLGQIRNHYDNLEFEFSRLLVLTPDFEFSRLLVLTPDFEFPQILNQLEEKSKLIWGNFDKIISGINSVLEDPILLIDRERFLLFELREFLVNQRLTSEDYSNKVLIVPAGKAWGEYRQFYIYKCQPDRTFQQSSYMGFYADGEIKTVFPKILGYIDSFNIQSDELKESDIVIVKENLSKQFIVDRIASLKKQLSENQWDEPFKYILLSENTDRKNTFEISAPIRNDKTSYSDKNTAFVQKQTYLDIRFIEGKEFTSEL